MYITRCCFSIFSYRNLLTFFVCKQDECCKIECCEFVVFKVSCEYIPHKVPVS